MRAPATTLSILIAALAAATGAHAAGEPTMRLSAVQPGMSCTARTVVHGTDISTFDVKIVDVIGTGRSAQILGRASGPVVDDTGVAEGFSGSPVSCPAPGGGSAIAGAVAFATGDYGNRLVLLTPIDVMLGDPVSPLPGGGRPLAGPSTVSGVSGPVAAALRRAARRAGRTLVTAPGAPVHIRHDATVPLVPGAAVAAALSEGTIGVGAIGTVTYVDGNRIWAFGHPFDDAGRRALMMTGAWVHAVVGSPLALENATPYKLASMTQTIGAITDDGPAGVSGLLGAPPHTFPLTVRITGPALKAPEAQVTRIADEEAVGLPTGVSALQQVLPIAVAQAALDGLRGSPSLQSGRMCIEIKVRGRSRPLGLCNRYVGGSPGSPGGLMPVDAGDVATTLAAYRFGPLDITGATVRMTVRRSSGIAYLRSVAVSPGRPRRGQMVTVRATAVVAGSGERIERTARVRVPRSAGRRVTVRVTGTAPDVGAASALDDAVSVTFDEPGQGGGSGPKSLAALADAVKKHKRDDRARVRVGGGGVVRMALRGDDDVRLGGAVSTTATVR